MPWLTVAAGPPGERVTPSTMTSELESTIGRLEGPITVMGLGGGVGDGGKGEVEVGTSVGKVTLWGEEAPGVSMMSTGAAGDDKVGFAGDRETIVPPGSEIADEPGRIVTGEPVEGVKTMNEAEGVIVIGELPIVAMTGAEDAAGFRADGGVGLGSDNS
jgi:hypothetical protein